LQNPLPANFHLPNIQHQDICLLLPLIKEENEPYNHKCSWKKVLSNHTLEQGLGAKFDVDHKERGSDKQAKGKSKNKEEGKS